MCCLARPLLLLLCVLARGRQKHARPQAGRNVGGPISTRLQRRRARRRARRSPRSHAARPGLSPLTAASASLMLLKRTCGSATSGSPLPRLSSRARLAQVRPPGGWLCAVLLGLAKGPLRPPKVAVCGCRPGGQASARVGLLCCCALRLDLSLPPFCAPKCAIARGNVRLAFASVATGERVAPGMRRQTSPHPAGCTPPHLWKRMPQPTSLPAKRLKGHRAAGRVPCQRAARRGACAQTQSITHR